MNYIFYVNVLTVTAFVMQVENSRESNKNKTKTYY